VSTGEGGSRGGALDALAAEAMRAAAAAARENARALLRFVREVGLQDDGEGGHRAATLAFTYEHEGRRMRLTAPVLALVAPSAAEVGEVEVVVEPGSGEGEAPRLGALRLRTAPAAMAPGMARVLSLLADAVQVVPLGPADGGWLPPPD